MSDSPNELRQLPAMTDANPQESVEDEATQVIDEIFSELDQMLKSGKSLPSARASAKALPPQSAIVVRSQSSTPLKPASGQRSLRPPERWQAAQTVECNHPPDPLEIEAEWELSSRSRPWEKVLLFSMLSTCVVLLALILWVLGQERLNWRSANPLGKQLQLSASDAEFIEYMQRSLETIEYERKIQSMASKAQANEDSPSASAEGAVAANLTPPRSENVYFAQSPQNKASSLPPPPPLPKLPPPPPPPKVIHVPPTSPTPKPTQSPQAVSAVSSASETSQAASSSDLPAVKPSTPPPLAQPESQVEETSGTITLVGLLELGNESTALLKIGDVTQRFRIGDAIGESDWTLVDIGEQKAVVRRDGEERSILVGEKF